MKSLNGIDSLEPSIVAMWQLESVREVIQAFYVDVNEDERF